MPLGRHQRHDGLFRLWDLPRASTPVEETHTQPAAPGGSSFSASTHNLQVALGALADASGSTAAPFALSALGSAAAIAQLAHQGRHLRVAQGKEEPPGR